MTDGQTGRRAAGLALLGGVGIWAAQGGADAQSAASSATVGELAAAASTQTAAAQTAASLAANGLPTWIAGIGLGLTLGLVGGALVAYVQRREDG